MASLSVKATELDFRTVDRMTYQYFQQGQWDSLIELGEKALTRGIDYYYLRMRIGIAYYETAKPLKASHHFKKALGFNADDQTAEEYLFYCYLNSGKPSLAGESFKRLTGPARLKADSIFDSFRFFTSVEAGPMFHSAETQVNSIDLDGNENIFGEISYPISGFYSNIGIGINFGQAAGLNAAYTYLGNNKKHTSMAGDSILLDEKISQSQHQVYIQVPLKPGKGITISPAFHYVNLSYTATEIRFDEEEQEYILQKQNFRDDDYIGLLSAEKDFGLFSIGIFGATANLNSAEQLQYGAYLLAYPFGNLELWSKTTLLNHRNDGINYPVLEQSTGFKTFDKLWGEVYFTVGPTVNYFNNQGYIVFNSNYIVKMIGGSRWTFYSGKNLSLSIDYKFLWRKAGFLQYTFAESGYFEFTTFPAEKELTFTTHMILGGVTWKL